MPLVIPERANGPKKLAEHLCVLYKDIPKKGKSELIHKWRSHFNHDWNDRLEDLLKHRDAPTVDERAWLKEHIELYHDNYFPKAISDEN